MTFVFVLNNWVKYSLKSCDVSVKNRTSGGPDIQTQPLFFKVCVQPVWLAKAKILLHPSLKISCNYISRGTWISKFQSECCIQCIHKKINFVTNS